jgi:hypothetical protein
VKFFGSELQSLVLLLPDIWKISCRYHYIMYQKQSFLKHIQTTV